MNDFKNRLPQNMIEKIIFMAVISIISVNIIAPIIAMLRVGFSWNNYLRILRGLPINWLAVIVVVLLSQVPAMKLKNLIVHQNDSFRVQILVNVLCQVAIVSAIMSILGVWISTRQVSVAPLYGYLNNWPRNFAIAFVVEILIAQPIAQRILMYKHKKGAK